MTYFADWKESQESGMLRDFLIKPEVIQGCEILYAAYTYEDYDGRALVLFKKDGKLYEVNGSHCSCMGLEDQWEPEETMVSALKLRKPYWTGGSDEDFQYFQTVLNKLEQEGL